MLYIPQSLIECSNCHRWLPFAVFYFRKTQGKRRHKTFQCRECRNKKMEEWRYLNPEKDKQYYAHRDKGKALNRERKYRQNHPEKASNDGKRFRTKHPNWSREYCHRKPEIKKANVHRRFARQHALASCFTQEHWRKALGYFGNCCAVCGRPQGLWHTLAADHWIPLSSPDCPGTVPFNILPLCHGLDGCNNSKGSRSPNEWLTKRFGPRKAKAILKKVEDYFAWVKEQD